MNDSGDGPNPETEAETVGMAEVSDSFREFAERQAAIETTLVGQEHRLVQVFQNAWHALKNTDWPLSRRVEAGAALLRYVFLGRATILVTIGLGGLLALHASFMLSDQNQKIDLENYLNTVNSELGEAQRNSQLSQLLAPLIEDLQASANEAHANNELSTSNTYRSVVKLDGDLAIRVAVLTQTFQPYRWIQGDVEANELLSPKGDSAFYRFMRWLRSLYDSGFGKTPISERLADSKIPVLTTQRQSPERGLLLVNLHALAIDMSELTRYNTTFENAYAPSARLDAIDLGNVIGPSASKPFNLRLADLSSASFERSNLTNVNFTMANLSLTNFDYAHAQNANFRAASFGGTSFIGARLQGADFRFANLGQSRFDFADLTNANLSLTVAHDLVDFSTACLVQESTLMPASFDWSSYSIPQGCCDQWADKLEPNFERQDSTGRCVATESARSTSREWEAAGSSAVR